MRNELMKGKQGELSPIVGLSYTCCDSVTFCLVRSVKAD